MKTNFPTLALAIILCFSLCGRLDATALLRPVADNALFNSDSNLIVYPGNDTTAYWRFFEKLDTLERFGTGNVTILQIGGSHIQAGMFSNRVRQNFAQNFPLANHDLVFPFSAARTNNPINYRTRYTGLWRAARNIQRAPMYELGLSGITLGTLDSTATISIRLRNDSVTPFSRITVLSDCKSAYAPRITVGDSLYCGRYEGLQRAFLFDLAAPTDSFTLSLVATGDSLGGDFTLRGFWLDNDAAGLSYVDVGVNGASVPSYLRCTLLESDLALVKPDLCILSIGINDASGRDFDTTFFKNNYSKLIARIHAVAPDCAILFTTNNDSYRHYKRRYYNNRNGALAEQAFLSLGQSYRSGVWDLFSLMGGLGSMRHWEQAGMARRDKIHFTQAGYELLGDYLYNALMHDYLTFKNETPNDGNPE